MKRTHLVSCARITVFFLLVSLIWAGGTSTARGQENPPAANEAKAARYWTTDWTFDDIDVGRLFSRLKSIGIEIPVRADGDVSVGFEVSIPITSLRDAKAYRFRGRVSSKRLRLEDLLLENFNTDIVYDDGIVTLADVRGRWIDAAGRRGGGSFTGDATAALVPRGDATVELQTDSLTLGPLYDLFVAATEQSDAADVQGILSGDLKLTAPLDAIGDLATWNATADLRLRDFRIGQALPLSVDTGPVTIDGGIVTAEDVRMTSPDAPEVQLNAAAQVELNEAKRFSFQLRGDDVPLEMLSALAARGSSTIDSKIADGKLDIDLTGRGAIESLDWKIDGRVASPRLAVLGQDLGLIEHRVEFDNRSLRLIPIHDNAQREEMLIKKVSSDYEITDAVVNVTDLSAEVFGGTVTGNARVPRGDGVLDVDLSWSDISPQINADAILPFDVPAADLKISATTSGTFDWTVPTDAVDRPARHQGTAKISISDLSIGQAEVGGGQLEITADNGTINLNGNGNALGGTFSVETTSPAGPDESWSMWLRKFPIGQVQIESANLSRIVPLVRPRESRRFRGTVSASATLRTELNTNRSDDLGFADKVQNVPDDERIVIEFAVDGLAIDGQTLSRGIIGKVRLVDGNLIIDRAFGSYAGGRVYANGRWPLGGDTRRLAIRFADIDAKAAFMPFSETVSNRVAGVVSGNLTVAGEQDYRIRGMIKARESLLFTVATGNIDSGIVGTVAGDLSRWSVKLGSITGELARGQIYGQAELSSTVGMREAFNLDSRWSVRRVDFGQLIAETGTTTSLAHGRITGSLSLGGRRIRTVNDLSGQFAAELNQTQASAVPGLLKANRFLGALSLAGEKFDEGEVSGTIGGGAYNIKEFWLRGDRARVYADGRIGIADLRMDLDAVIATGALEADNAKLLALAGQLAIESFIPISLIVEINRIFSNRTIYLNVTGPLSDPRLRLKPIETLRREAARFLVREAIILVTSGARMND